MQLIKDFSDIQRFVSFLNQDYQQRFLADVNALLVRYMDEQSRGASTPAPLNNISQIPIAPTQIQPPMPPTAPNSNFIKPTLPKPTFTPIQSNSPSISSPQMGLGGLNLNRNLNVGNNGGFNGSAGALPPSRASKRPQVTFIEAINYITPTLTELGSDLMRTPSIPMETFKLLKQFDGRSSIKEIHHSEYNNITLGNFIEKAQGMYKERYINFKKKAGLPQDFELSMKLGDILLALDIIDEPALTRALQVQKNPPSETQQNQAQSAGPAWLNKTMSMIDSNVENKAPVRKKLIGDTLVELKIITQDQLNFALAVQRLFKNIIESR